MCNISPPPHNTPLFVACENFPFEEIINQKAGEEF